MWQMPGCNRLRAIRWCYTVSVFPSPRALHPLLLITIRIWDVVRAHCSNCDEISLEYHTATSRVLITNTGIIDPAEFHHSAVPNRCPCAGVGVKEGPSL